MTPLNAALLLLFALLVLGIMLRSSQRRSGLVQYPFLAAVVMAGWVFPQLVGLSIVETAPPEAVAKTIIFSGLCLLAGWLGYSTNLKPARALSWSFSTGRLKVAAAILSVVGYMFWLRVFHLAEEATTLTGGQWTGAITIYVFLAGMLTVGLAIALVVHLHRPSLFSGSIILFDLTLILERVLSHARREVMMELFVFTMLYLWWRYRWLPPRTLIISAVLFGTLIVNSTGDIRASLAEQQGSGTVTRAVAIFSDIGSFSRNLHETFTNPARSNELLNAALTIEAAERRLSFDLGANLWNRFVHSYVPAQIIGAENKRSLMIPVQYVAFQEFGHIPHTGSTQTGIADAFRSFWYFGAGIFFIIGLVMNRWFRAANAGHPAAQMIVLLVTTKSLLAITHSTPHFFLQFVTLAAFLVPVLFLSRTDVVFGYRSSTKSA